MIAFSELYNISMEDFIQQTEELYAVIADFQIPEFPEPKEVYERLSALNVLRDAVRNYSMVIDPQYIRLNYLYKVAKDCTCIGKNTEERKSFSAKYLMEFMMDKDTYKSIFREYPKETVKNGDKDCVMVNLVTIMSDSESKQEILRQLLSMVDRKHDALSSISFLVNSELKATTQYEK